MTIKHIFIFIFSLTMQIGTAQQNYTEKDLNTFVKIYMSSKVDKKRNSINDKKIFDRYNVTP